MRGATSAGSEQGLVAALPVGGPLGWGAGRGRQVRPSGEGARVGVAPAVCGWFGLAGLRCRRAGFAWAPPLGRGPVDAGRLVRAGSGRVLRGRQVAGFPQAFRWREWVCDDDGVVYFPPPVEVVP